MLCDIVCFSHCGSMCRTIICQTLRPYKLSPFVCQSGNKSYRLADRIADGRYVIAGGPVGIS